ncbi:hypothetical protein [Rhizobium sp. SSA_523]|uniref:hypothetical protein n=1 Tax=Rhizobium sp. SSA_523 TaxID=2952477 RepID=UPI002090A823|nr:hypothetical protein [Rhizobium sp. SSA_523]MCO5729983.1 hypothetical protein [Rhizobium sp. SSA_523]WKC25059.1 hypothetical protein QTJ18_13755 [Rhizobium sp. SSA_523]
MVSRFFSLKGGLSAAASLALIASVASAHAASRDQVFFENAAGAWKGPGEIVAGKYKGTKFTCNLVGAPNRAAEAGITLDGTCRVGVFKQPMNAVITQAGSSYTGKFLDGADGKGLDIVSGAVNGDKIVVGINRAKLNGAMIARMQDNNAMNITISVKVEDQMVPVIGLALTRESATDPMAVGAIKP